EYALAQIPVARLVRTAARQRLWLARRSNVCGFGAFPDRGGDGFSIAAGPAACAIVARATPTPGRPAPGRRNRGALCPRSKRPFRPDLTRRRLRPLPVGAAHRSKLRSRQPAATRLAISRRIVAQSAPAGWPPDAADFP